MSAEAGMNEMSDKFNAMGWQVYVDADKIKAPHTTALDTEAAHHAKSAALVKESNKHCKDRRKIERYSVQIFPGDRAVAMFVGCAVPGSTRQRVKRADRSRFIFVLCAQKPGFCLSSGLCAQACVGCACAHAGFRAAA
jgi:hypothetical protein